MKQNLITFPKCWLQLGLTSALAAIFTINTHAQTVPAPSTQWDVTIGGSGLENFQDMQQTTDGGYILGGFSYSGISGDKTQASQGNFDYWIVKLDASGNKSWDRSFGGSDAELLYAVQQTNDGGFILGGASVSGVSGDKTQASRGNADFWIVKTNASGNKQWDKSFGGSDNDRLYSLQQTSDGGYILAGF